MKTKRMEKGVLFARVTRNSYCRRAKEIFLWFCLAYHNVAHSRSDMCFHFLFSEPLSMFPTIPVSIRATTATRVDSNRPFAPSTLTITLRKLLRPRPLQPRHPSPLLHRIIEFEILRICRLQVSIDYSPKTIKSNS